MPTRLVAAPSSVPLPSCGLRPVLLRHSDLGSQYASNADRNLLSHHGCVPSMNRTGNRYDHAKMASFRPTLKGELIIDHAFATRAQAKSIILRYHKVSTPDRGSTARSVSTSP